MVVASERTMAVWKAGKKGGYLAAQMGVRRAALMVGCWGVPMAE